MYYYGLQIGISKNIQIFKRRFTFERNFYRISSDYIHFMCTFILNVINSFVAFLPSRNWHIKGDVNEPGTYIQLHMIFEMYCILKVNVTHKPVCNGFHD